jgi:hypothetical protein
MLLDAMFLDPPGFNPSFLPLAIAGIGTIVGFFWIRRITTPDEDKEPSSWRYRQVEGIGRPLKVGRLPTPGWIATRLAMVVSVGVLAFVLFAPGLLEDFGSAVAYAPWLWIAAIALASAGTFWIFRVALADPESGTKTWRYRD